MDLQLYRIDDQNYLVDFRNLGYRSIKPPSPALSQLSTSAASTSYIESVAASSLPSATSSHMPNTADELRARKPNAGLPLPTASASASRTASKRHTPGVEVSSPYLFLECAVRLIVELASPTSGEST